MYMASEAAPRKLSLVLCNFKRTSSEVPRVILVSIRITWNTMARKRRLSGHTILKMSVASIIVLMILSLVVVSMLTAFGEATVKIYPGNPETGESLHKTAYLNSVNRPPHRRVKFNASHRNVHGRSLQHRSIPDWDIWAHTRRINAKPTCNRNAKVLIIITSAPTNFDKRAMIRKTWCSTSDQETNEHLWQCVFLVGMDFSAADAKIKQEIRNYGDVLLGNYRDTYRNLTYKVVTGFHWVAQECHPLLMLKTDDDCFVNIYLLLRVIRAQEKDLDGLYTGSVFLTDKETKVIRNPESKWSVSYSDYPLENYPPYASGTGYLLSGNLVGKVLHLMQEYKPFPNEDAYVGVLLNQIGVDPVHSNRFTLYSGSWNICNYQYLLVIHHVTAELQQVMHTNAKQTWHRCPSQEFITTWN